MKWLSLICLLYTINSITAAKIRTVPMEHTMPHRQGDADLLSAEEPKQLIACVETRYPGLASLL